MNIKNKNRKKNYLDFVPVHNPAIQWQTNENNEVTLIRQNNGRIEKITQKLFKTPEVTTIRLEQFGDFIWPLIDGNRTVYDIAQLVSERFGKEAEPLYERLIQYFQTMQYQKFIYFK